MYLYNELKEKDKVTAWNYKKLYPSFLFPGMTQYLREGEAFSNRIIHSFNPLSWAFSSKKIPAKSEDILLYSYWHPFFIPAIKSHIRSYKKRGGGRVIGVFHNIRPHESFPFQDRLLTSLLNVTDKAILLSGKTKEELLQYSNKIPYTTLFHPVYEQEASDKSLEELRLKYGIKEGQNVILFFGLIRDYKGLDIFIDAINTLDLKKLNLKPLIVGEFYSNKSPLLGRIKEEHRSAYIIKDEFITNDEMAEVFKVSALTVLPYKNASQSGILANAINFGVPAIVSNQPGFKDYITNQVNGRILVENNAEELAQALQDAILKQQISSWKKELEQLKDKYSWKNFGDAFIKAIHN